MWWGGGGIFRGIILLEITGKDRVTLISGEGDFFRNSMVNNIFVLCFSTSPKDLSSVFGSK